MKEPFWRKYSLWGSWIALTLTYPPPGTTIWINTEHVIYFGRNIVSEKGKGTVIYVAGNKFVVMESPEEIQKIIKETKAKEAHIERQNY